MLRTCTLAGEMLAIQSAAKTSGFGRPERSPRTQKIDRRLGNAEDLMHSLTAGFRRYSPASPKPKYRSCRVDEQYDSFPAMNIDECDRPIRRTPFLFEYTHVLVWQDGECIAEEGTTGYLDASLEGKTLSVARSDEFLDYYLARDFEFCQISENIDRVMWTQDVYDLASVTTPKEPAIMSLFYRNGELARVGLHIINPDVLIELYGGEVAQEGDEDPEQIDLSEFFFMSSDHVRFQSGQQVTGHNRGCYRAVTVAANGDDTYSVSILKQDGPHPVWNDNYTMIPKRMEIVSSDNESISLRGVGADSRGFSFEDYGITINYPHGSDSVESVILHMLDRDVDILYLPMDVGMEDVVFGQRPNEKHLQSEIGLPSDRGEAQKHHEDGAPFADDDNLPF
jgi:hypothetical protein